MPHNRFMCEIYLALHTINLNLCLELQLKINKMKLHKLHTLCLIRKNRSVIQHTRASLRILNLIA